MSQKVHSNKLKWMSFMIGCDSWDIESHSPPMRWDDHPDTEPEPINTSFPILFISNTHDPVTPLHAGLRMSKKFVNSGFLEQKSMGHCSISNPSFCTLTKVQQYLRDGVVPSHPKFDEGSDDHGELTGEWETCEVDDCPWGVCE